MVRIMHESYLFCFFPINKIGAYDDRVRSTRTISKYGMFQNKIFKGMYGLSLLIVDQRQIPNPLVLKVKFQF